MNATQSISRGPRPISGGPRWWQWLTVLSLDAPAVALAWQMEFARAAGTTPQRSHAFVLGASTWLAYAADRWIEGWRLAPGQVRTQRHRFYQRWRWPIGVVWLLVLGTDLAVALTGLTRREFTAGLLLLAPVLAYLLSHQLVHRDRRWRAPKEICVGLLFAGGAALFPLAQPGAAWLPLVGPIALFFILCFTNCALISVWEHEVDEAHGQTSLSLQSRRARRLARVLPWILAVAAAAAVLMTMPIARPAVWCVAASAVLLGIVDRAEKTLGWRGARVLADVALLTPLVLWPGKPLLG